MHRSLALLALTALSSAASVNQACSSHTAMRCISSFVASGCNIEAGAPTIKGLDCANDVPVECVQSACGGQVGRTDTAQWQGAILGETYDDVEDETVRRELQETQMEATSMPSSIPVDTVTVSVPMSKEYSGDITVDDAFEAQLLADLQAQLPADLQGAEIKDVKILHTTSVEMSFPASVTAKDAEAKLAVELCGAAKDCTVTVTFSSADSSTQRRALSSRKATVSVIQPAKGKKAVTFEASAMAGALGIDESEMTIDMATLTTKTTVTYTVVKTEAATSSAPSTAQPTQSPATAAAVTSLTTNPTTKAPPMLKSQGVAFSPASTLATHITQIAVSVSAVAALLL